MSAVLDRTLEQRLAALAKANRIRFARAALKVAIRDGDIEAWTVVDAPHPDYETMRVVDLLAAVPGLGPVKVRRLMRTHQVSETKTLAGLTRRQRDELVTRLRSRP